jgi:hypothetical protein
MGRLILFTLFLTLLAVFSGLYGHRETFDKKENLSLAHYQSEVAKFVESQKEAPIVEETEDEELLAEGPPVIDMEDPMIIRAIAVYNGKGQCLKCHGEQAQGVPEQEGPLLAGQYDWYIEDQLKLMKAGVRVNEKMNPYLAEIDEEDIKALAKYISLLRVE